jgi:hypothetical protein
MKIPSQWPKNSISWPDGDKVCISVPFTWLVPKVRDRIISDGVSRQYLLGGPGTALVNHFYPDYFDGLPILTGIDMPGVLQRFNNQATRTTTGCPNRCPWCAVPILEPGGLTELPDWEDRPVIIDNNITAASLGHFDRVMDRLEKHGWCDFCQGVDARLLNGYHAERMSRIRQSIIRLALDSTSGMDHWGQAYSLLRSYGVAKRRIRSYVLVGFDTDPADAWYRCMWIESHGVKPLPMWYHPIDSLEHNIINSQQQQLGWTDYERRRLFQWFYQHKQAKRK